LFDRVRLFPKEHQRVGRTKRQRVRQNLINVKGAGHTSSFDFAQGKLSPAYNCSGRQGHGMPCPCKWFRAPCLRT